MYVILKCDMAEFGNPAQPRHQPEEVDRPRGILSPRDREYLLGEADIEPTSQAARNVRAAIRERLENAILDFTLLFQHLEERDREKVFDELVGERPPQDADYAMMPQGVCHAIALLYLEHRHTEDFAATVLEALREVANKRDEFREIEVSITFKSEMDIDELEQRLTEGELTIRDVGQHYNDGRISLDSLLRLVDESDLSGALRGSENEEGG
jgi:phosphopantothenate synthetase